MTHDRVGHVRGCDLELERDDLGAVAVEMPRRHGLVQTTKTTGLGQIAGFGPQSYLLGLEALLAEVAAYRMQLDRVAAMVDASMERMIAGSRRPS